MTATPVETCAGTSLIVAATFASVPVNLYDVSFSIGGSYFTGSGRSVLAVIDPSSGSISGAGTITNPRTGQSASFNLSAQYSRTRTRGAFLYVEHTADGDLKVQAEAFDALALVGNEAIFWAKNVSVRSASGNEIRTGFSLRLRAVDNGESGRLDALGIQLRAPDGRVVWDWSQDPATLQSGNISILKRGSR